ncbi:MAG TPA: tetratricopeptide repeat protein [Gemmatimonadota bacterium]|nr:tetratricopeptide repeat protein [Gemmatimonadota bacterium]
MKSTFPTIALFAALAAPAAGQDAAAFVARGDALMGRMRTEAAIAAYREGLTEHPDHPELLWRTSRALGNLAEETPGESGDEVRHVEAVRLARRAVAADAGDARAQATLAAAVGKLALHRGGRRKVELAREVHETAARAIALDPADFGGFAVLGVWNREVATLNPILRALARTLLGGLPDASVGRSQALLERAVRIEPGAIPLRYELARTLVETGQEARARAELRRALELTPREGLDRVYQEKARLLLAQLE